MAEHVTGSDLRARADGLKTVVEGDASTFSREALVTIMHEIRKDLAAAANTLEAHELHRRQTEPAGAEPPAVNAAKYSPPAGPSSAEPSSVEPAPTEARREAAHEDKPHRGKDRVEK